MEFSVDDLGPSSIISERYMVLEELGEDIFGKAYQSVELETDQQVVIKLLHPGRFRSEDSTAVLSRPKVDDEPTVDKQEMRAQFKKVINLRHPHMSQLQDAGHLKSSNHIYLIRHFLEGETLAEVLAEEGKLNPKEAVHVMLQVLDAMSYAHSRDVLHRELTPAHIIIGAGGVRRNAFVLDFGIVSLMDVIFSLSHDTPIGDPAYKAPEVLTREPEASPQSDIYAWGLIFIEILTGRPVYTGEPHDIIAQQRKYKPVEIPEKIRKTPLGPIIEKAVHKDAESRYSSASEPYQELEALLFKKAKTARARKSVPKAAPVSPKPKSEKKEDTPSPKDKKPSSFEEMPQHSDVFDAIDELDDDFLSPQLPRNNAPRIILALVVLVGVGIFVYVMMQGGEAAPPPPEPEVCQPGQQRPDDIHCCWPGQTWDGDKCRGEPESCPEGTMRTGSDCQKVRQ